MTDVVALREYESRSVVLSVVQAAELARVAGNRLSVRASGSEGVYEVKAGAHVGAIVTSSLRVLVVPKVPLRNLFLLLGVAPPHLEDAPFDFGREDDLLSIMAWMFAHEVDRATSRGVLRGYRYTEESLVSPRGRIDIRTQIRRPGINTPMPCTFDEFTADHTPNRVLLAALDRVARVPGLAMPARLELNRIRPRFEEVALVRVDPQTVDRWQPTRLDVHYEAAMRMAGVILHNLSLGHDIQGARVAAASFTIDMNDLFQRFVADRLRRALRGRLDVGEEPRIPLAVNGRLTMRPDLVFARRGDTIYVGDTKYKLSQGPARMGDYYQLLAYLTAMGLKEGVLIYAQDPGDDADPISEELVHTVRVRNTDKVIHVFRLPLDGRNEDVEAGLRTLGDWIAAGVMRLIPPGDSGDARPMARSEEALSGNGLIDDSMLRGAANTVG